MAEDQVPFKRLFVALPGKETGRPSRAEYLQDPLWTGGLVEITDFPQWPREDPHARTTRADTVRTTINALPGFERLGVCRFRREIETFLGPSRHRFHKVQYSDPNYSYCI